MILQGKCFNIFIHQKMCTSELIEVAERAIPEITIEPTEAVSPTWYSTTQQVPESSRILPGAKARAKGVSLVSKSIHQGEQFQQHFVFNSNLKYQLLI